MATNKTEIANLAIGHLGGGEDIDDLDTENSAVANACRRFYELSRKNVLRAYPWPFASKTLDLVWVADNPTVNWLYAYQYPTDCLMFKYILSGLDRIRTPINAVPYRIGTDGLATVLYTDQQDATAEYTMDVSDVTRFTPDFEAALSLHLASMIAPRVTAGDPFKMGERAMRLWVMQYTTAMKNAGNEEQPDPQPDSDMITGRV